MDHLRLKLGKIFYSFCFLGSLTWVYFVNKIIREERREWERKLSLSLPCPCICLVSSFFLACVFVCIFILSLHFLSPLVLYLTLFKAFGWLKLSLAPTKPCLNETCLTTIQGNFLPYTKKKKFVTVVEKLFVCWIFGTITKEFKNADVN